MVGNATVRFRTPILFPLAVCGAVGTLPAIARADSATNPEYQLKAAFLYNFVMFIDGDRFDRGSDEKKTPDPNEPIVMGIVGADPFGKAFDPLKDRTIRHRRVVVRRFKGLEEFADADGNTPRQHPQLEALKASHVLFVCASERQYVHRILHPIHTLGILTVADTPGFLEAGGMINFVIAKKKVRFEINKAAAERARLQIRSRLLRLAKRVVEYGPPREPR